MEEEKKKENIVMFPFMAQGHIIPFLALSLQLEQRGYIVTFINTPKNIAHLRRAIPPSSAVHLLEIPFNSTNHGLPPESENTDSLPPNLFFNIVMASTSLKSAFKNIISGMVDGGSPPLCVVADFFFGWAAEISHEFGIFHVIFSGSGGFGLACYHSAWINMPHKKSDSGEFWLPDFQEAGKFQVSQLTPSLVAATGDDPWSKFVINNLRSWENCDGFLFNTIEDVDKFGLSYFRRKFSKPVWAIGPLINQAQSLKNGGINKESCIKWLNSKPQSSVLYISFGSQSTISSSQMIQLAKALDESKKNFIWVVRPPSEFDINGEFKAEEWLPENFKKHVVGDQNRGLIVEKWAPQMEILSHKSVGAFMSHCGWNSVLESLSRGVPLLGWPMAAEQFYNAKMMEEIAGVCVEVARGSNSEVKSQEILKKIEVVMSDNGKGREMRKKACEIMKMIGDAIRDEEQGFKGSSVVAMQDFLEAALLMKKTNGQQKM